MVTIGGGGKTAGGNTGRKGSALTPSQRREKGGGKAPRGTSRIGNRFFNPTTGEEISSTKAQRRAAPTSFSISGIQLSNRGTFDQAKKFLGSKDVDIKSILKRLGKDTTPAQLQADIKAQQEKQVADQRLAEDQQIEAEAGGQTITPEGETVVDQEGRGIPDTQLDPETGEQFIINEKGEKEILFGGGVTAVTAGDLTNIATLGAGGAALTTTKAIGKKVLASTSKNIFTKKAASKTGKAASNAAIKKGNAGAAELKVNSKTQKQTKNWFQKIGGTSTLLGVIGSYPFAGFIKEEALQTLGFATTTARDNGDVEGEIQSIQDAEELLNPTAWDQIINAVPFANVIKQLKNFYDAARTKLEIDKKSLERRQQGILTPEEERFEPFRQKAIRENEEAGQGFSIQ